MLTQKAGADNSRPTGVRALVGRKDRSVSLARRKFGFSQPGRWEVREHDLPVLPRARTRSVSCWEGVLGRTALLPRRLAQWSRSRTLSPRRAPLLAREQLLEWVAA